MTIEWIHTQLHVLTSFDRYIDMKESPPLLDILVEIACAQPLQQPHVFRVLAACVEQEWEDSDDVTPLQMEGWKRVFVDFVTVLLKLGLATAGVFDFFARMQEYLRVHFVSRV